MTFHVRLGVCLAPALFGAVPAPATAQGYKGYPYSIMTPEAGPARRHHGVKAIPPADTRTAYEPAAPRMPRYPRRALVARDRQVRCCRRRCRKRNSFRLKDRAPR